MERVWLTIAILSFLISAWFITKTDWSQAGMPMFVTVCALLLFALRRYQRKKLEKLNKP